MIIDFKQKFTTLSGMELPGIPPRVPEGEEDKEKDDKKKKKKIPALTLEDVCTNALLGTFEDEKGKVDGVEKLKRYRFADRLFGTKEPISLDSEEITLLKTLVAKTYSVLVSGQAWEMLESGEAEPKKPKETTVKEKK